MIAPLPKEGAGPGEFGWPGVVQGLGGILWGYFLTFLNIGMCVCLGLGVAMTAKKTHGRIEGDAATVLFIGILVIGLTSAYSAFVVLRGQWRCMVNAPERCAARWFMFAAMLCLLGGPLINFASGLFGGFAPTRIDREEADKIVAKRATKYIESMRQPTLIGYLRFGGTMVGSLAPIFFTLFLHAVSRCLKSAVGARFIELYLAFDLLLILGTISLLADLPRLIRDPQPLIVLGIGWLVAGLWHILLIGGSIMGITAHLNSQRAPLAA